MNNSSNHPGAIRAAIIVLLSVVLCAGCVTSKEQKDKRVYMCPDGYSFTAEFAANGESVAISAGEDAYKLDRQVAASGAKYSDDEMTFWSKGAMAYVETADGVEHRDCQGNSD